MSRRLRRLVLLLVPVLLLALAGCGSSSSSSSAATSTDPLDAVSITGAVGTKPQVEWKTKFTANDVQTTTLTKGDGDTIAEGDQVQAQIWIGNGFSQKEAYSTYDQGGAQTLTLNGQLSPVFADAIKGAAVGSRIVVTAPADELVGEGGNADLGISNKDPLLVVIDLLGKPKPPLDGPQGKPQPSPAWAPKLVTKGDKVTGLDFAKTPKPDGKLRSAVLIQGTGATVKKGQSITVNYLGQVYQAKQPFDESYTKEPATFGIGTGQVIPGWDKTLVGQKVGSRVILAIPPQEGYGKQGQPQAGIKGTDTLYFVVDILGAA
ncbi:MAG TPA: FKBP-type peptidyl-prolyl cis-trans isomerase [Nocardioides sp.]|nr:FKBP-type peptidyl-prolyl cis-trans isomerase [Nocardioides sp.]